MSGNFCQRGEPSILDKFTRAKHAIIAGADVVIELPTIFATANAEIFAKGAIKTINSLGVCNSVCFGVESGSAEDYIALANAMNNETKEFKKILKEKLESGISLAKAKYETLKALGNSFNEELVSSPNNVLALEYVKAILSSNKGLEIHPMLRTGDHNDKALKKGITSATSIRLAVKGGQLKKVKKNMPPFVYKDIVEFPHLFDKIIMSALIRTDAQQMNDILDCTEGLENRIKALSKDNRSVEELVEMVTTKRYTSSRIRRILIANLLGIKEKFVRDGLESPLYAKVLAVNENSKELLSLITKSSIVPVLMRKSDAVDLKKTAKRSFEIDTLACDLYSLATNQKLNEHYTLFI